MNSDKNAAISLASDSEIDKRVAGLMLGLRFLEFEDWDEETESDYIQKLCQAATPSFIIRLATAGFETPNDMQSLKLSDIGLNLLTLVCKCSANLEQFTDFLHAPLIAMIKQTDVANSHVIDSLELITKCIAAYSNQTQRVAALELVLNECTIQNIPPLKPLHVIEEICKICTSDYDEINYKLSTEGSVRLQNMVIQGMYGGAPEAVRDATLQSVANLTKSSPHCYLHQSWTIAGSNDGGITEPESQECSNDQTCSRSRFAKLLTSVLGVELHLLHEELLCLLDQHNLSTSTDSASSSTSSSSLKRVVRLSRAKTMLDTCLQLLDNILTLLVGSDDDTMVDNEGDDNHNDYDNSDSASARQGREAASDSDSVPVWAVLSGEHFLQVQQSNHTVFKELLDLVKSCCDLLRLDNEDTKCDNATKGAQGPVSLDRATVAEVVTRVLVTLGRWLTEDQALLQPFLDCLPCLLSVSCFNEAAGASKLLVTNALGFALNSDSLIWMLPCLITVRDCLNTDNEGEDSGLEGDQRSVDCTLALLREQFLCTSGLLGALLSLLTHLARCLARTTTASEEVEMMDYCAMTTDLVVYFFTAHRASLQALYEGEGSQAVTSVLRVPIHRLEIAREAAEQALKKVATMLGEHDNDNHDNDDNDKDDYTLSSWQWLARSLETFEDICALYEPQ